MKYARYTLGNSINTLSTLITASRTANTAALGNPLEFGYRADMREGDVYGSYYAQTWKGYFTAPVDGMYTFRGTADDQFSLYLAADYGSTELPTSPLIQSTTAQIMDSFYLIDIVTAEADINLLSGKSYYLEAYHINFGGTGFFDLEVDIPNLDNTVSWQVYQVDEIVTNSTIQP